MPRSHGDPLPELRGKTGGDADEAYVRRIKGILKRERLAKGMTFRKLEAESGISFGYLATSERSDNQPTVL